MRRVLFGCMAVVSLARAADLTPSELLSRIRTRMAEALKGLPNYTCRETIERSVRPKHSQRFETADLLRLEVAYLEGREMFAWPGSPRFGDKNIQELVPHGAISSGNFGSLAEAVFVSGAAVFTFDGKDPGPVHNQVRFRFRVRRDKSQLAMNHDGDTAIVGYQGFFTADPESYEVNLFEVDADDIPWSLQIAEGQERMEYARARIGTSDYLLPKIAEVMVLDFSGQTNRNHITFDSCHEFTGDSSVTFADPATLPAAPVPPAAAQPLPAGIELQLRLTAPVERGVTAVGDLVTGEIIKPVSHPITIAQGAAVILRVISIQSLTRGKDTFQAAFFEMVSVKAGEREYVGSALLRSVKSPGRFYATIRGGGIAFRSASLQPGVETTWRTVKQP